MSTIAAPAETVRDREPRLIRRMRLCFALLSCLGGLAMGLGGDDLGFPVIAAFFAVFGYLCVDWLKLFALPATLAYLGMGCAGLYCIGEFTNPGRQIQAVAELLIIVQAIMMLQEKTQRVYEQIVIFCLLQLVVAAVFNDAIMYGLLLFPIGLVGAWANSLLSAFAAARFRDDSQSISDALNSVDVTDDQIFTSAEEAQWSLSRASRRVFWIACSTMAPAVLLVTGVFFYALPRTTDANRTNQGGMAMIGFSDKVQLQQVGNLLRNDTQALRVRLTDAQRRTPYLVSEPMYLRGKVLESYSFTGSGLNVGTWEATAVNELSRDTNIPTGMDIVPVNPGASGDDVEVTFSIESTNTSALFSIAPYFATISHPQVRHQPLRWTLTRSRRASDEANGRFPRIKYKAGTRGFRNGLQSEKIAVWSRSDAYIKLSNKLRDLENGSPLETSDTNDSEPLTPRQREDRIEAVNRKLDRLQELLDDYIEVCSRFDRRRIPAASYIGDQVWSRLPAERRDRYQFARAATNYLNSGVAGFTYTVDLNFKRNEQLDPIQQFLAIDKAGHCQYYASALAMILRSRGIPCRLVAGYCTDEYNGVAGHYVARQLHAHVWVEALFDCNEVANGSSTPEMTDLGELTNTGEQKCWVRLDATPGGGGGGVAGNSNDGGVTQVMDLAKNIWKDYVVDMDSERQEQVLLASATDAGMSDAYGDLIRRGQIVLLNLRAGRLGGGSLAGRNLFSWPAAILAIMAAAILLVVMRIRIPSWLRVISRDKTTGDVARPSLAFYADAVDALSEVGVHRGAAQTPFELQQQANKIAGDGKRPPSEPFAKLTDLFVRARYGNSKADESVTKNLVADLGDRIKTSNGPKPKRS